MHADPLSQRDRQHAEPAELVFGGDVAAAFRRFERPPGVSSVVSSPGRYDDTVNAQPAEREDPLDPQRILDDLPADEHGFFLDQYRGGGRQRP